MRLDSSGTLVIGATTAGARLDVRAQGALSTDIAFRVRNSADTTNLFEVQGNGFVRSNNGSNSSFEFAGNYKFHQSVQGFSTNGACMFEVANISGNPIGSLRTHTTTGQVLVYLSGDVQSSGINGKIDLRRNNINKITLASSLEGGHLIGVNYARFINGVTALGAVDSFDIYSADIVAGNAAPHFRTENGSVIKLYQQSAVTSSQGLADVLTNVGLLSGSSVIAPTFPYTGSAEITGSLTVTGSVAGAVQTLAIISSTASLDLSQGNFFELTLSSSTTTYLEPINIQPGQTINLKINQPATSGSLTYDNTLKFPGGIPYNVSSTGSVVDILSMVSFDNSTLYATAIKNLS
jgi:hypothetical protein